MEVQDDRVSSIFSISLVRFLAALLLFIALLQGERNLVVLTLLVLVLFEGTKLWAKLSLAGVRCRFEVERKRLFPGEVLRLRAIAENTRLLPVWLQVKIPVPSGFAAEAGEAMISKEVGLLWKQWAALEWEFRANHRGVHRVGPPIVKTGDLFGFFSRQREVEGGLEVIVYPRLVPLRSFSSPRRDLFGIPGARSPVHDPVYVLGTRDYQHGQPAKHIHWKASARFLRLQEKVFEPTSQEKLLLVVVVDSFARHQANQDFEETLEIVASLAVRSERQGFAVGLLTNGKLIGQKRPDISVSRGARQLATLLETLARLEMEPSLDLLDLFKQGFDLPWGSSCVYFSYEQDQASLAVSQYCGHRRIPIVFFLGLFGGTSEKVTRARRMIHPATGLRIEEVPGR